MIVFIDEAGDPGFKLQHGSSEYFVIACIIFDDFLEAEKCSVAIKDLRRRLKLNDRFEFKFNKSNRKFRQAFFQTVKIYQFRVRAIVINKNQIRSHKLKTNKESFYNYTVMQVLKQSNKSIKNAKLKIDKRGERTLRNELRVYLSRRLDNKNNKIFTDLKFVDSRQNTLIQLADMVAGAVFSGFGGKERDYLRILKQTRKIEDVWRFK